MEFRKESSGKNGRKERIPESSKRNFIKHRKEGSQILLGSVPINPKRSFAPEPDRPDRPKIASAPEGGLELGVQGRRAAVVLPAAASDQSRAPHERFLCLEFVGRRGLAPEVFLSVDVCGRRFCFLFCGFFRAPPKKWASVLRFPCAAAGTPYKNGPRCSGFFPCGFRLKPQIEKGAPRKKTHPFGRGMLLGPALPKDNAN